MKAAIDAGLARLLVRQPDLIRAKAIQQARLPSVPKHRPLVW